MYIGKLNEFKYQVYSKNTKTVPTINERGSMLNGDCLYISWKELLETGVDIYVSIGKRCLINEVVLRLGEGSFPTSIKVFTANKEKELYCYSAETGKGIQEKELALPVEMETTDFVLEVNVDFADVIVENIDIYGADLSGERLFPTPKEYVELSETEILACKFNSCSFAGENGEAAAKVLREKFEEQTGIPMCVAEEGKVKFEEDASISENGYYLTVKADQVVIAAADLRGMVYGAETFLKVIKEDVITECEIKDEPRMWFRGVHLMLPHPDEFAYAKRFVKYVLSPMGYNYIILEIAGGMEFESHPEINEAVEEAFIKGANGEWPLFPHKEAGMGKTVSKATMKDFVAYCRAFGIDVIPEIQSLGHVQFMTLAHPEIGEWPEATEEEKIDERLADIPPDKFYAHCYCPSNPKSYEILFDLIDEIVEVFEPREYVHMGHDEVYEIGICSVCKHRDPAELLAEDINKIYDYVSQKGLKMMIWADMLQPITKYKTPNAIYHIPKDILMLDFIWYFHPEKDTEDNILPHGFPVVLGNMYSSHFPRYNTRIIKEGVVGAQVSSWVITSEEVMAREGKIYEFLYAPQMLWSENYSVHSRYAYDRIVSAMIPKLREELGDKKYPSLNADKTETVLVDHGMYQPGEEMTYGGKFSLNCMADSLLIEHTASEKITRIPWEELDEIGQYVVTYADGSNEVIPVQYCGNISHWNRRHNEPFKGKYYRHNGYQGVSYYTDGIERFDEQYGNITTYRYEWINPHPEKVISEIVYVADEKWPTDVYVSRILGVK